MAEETNINEVIERVKSRVANSQHAAGTAMIDTEDALAMIAELETLRTAHEIALDGLTAAKSELIGYKVGYERVSKERDALRTWLERISLLASSGQDDTIVDTLQSTIRITREFAEEALSTAALNTQPAPAPAAEWTPRFVVGETVRVDRFIDDAFAGWLGEIEQIKRVGDTYEYYLAAKNQPGFQRYPFGWFAEKLLDNNDNVPDWVEGMGKEAD